MVRHLIDLESFVTLSYARFDLSRQQLDLVDCGHTGMMLAHARTGGCEILHGTNLPLGIRQGEIFAQMTVAFEPEICSCSFPMGLPKYATPPEGETVRHRLLLGAYWINASWGRRSAGCHATSPRFRLLRNPIGSATT